MTGRATFGEFAAAASAHLARAVSLTDPVASGWATAVRALHASEIRRGMARIVPVLSRYVTDITASYLPESRWQMDVLAAWSRAAVDARQALAETAALLAPDREQALAVGSSLSRPASPVGRELDSAIRCMTAGRDLLHTHLSAQSDGTRGYRSEWAPVIVSTPVTGALLVEVAQWAQMIASRGHQAAQAMVRRRGDSRTEEAFLAQRRLTLASESLLKVHWAARRADERQPVSAADMRLLHAIPANLLPARRSPGPHELAADLCRGTSDCAERTRYAAGVAAPLASWSPYLTSDSLAQAAASATAISHHCSIVLRTLSARALRFGTSSVSAQLNQSATAAERAREAWLGAARMWELVTTETRGFTSPGAAETADLALWTGRLAFADSAWSLAQGPARPWRAPESLSPRFRDLPAVVAAAHQACDALVQLAAADHEQIWQAVRAGRLYSPTRTLPEKADIPHPFGRAPRSRVNLLLDTYRKAHQASAQTTAAVAEVAEAVRAPSTVLAAARAATQATSAGLRFDRIVIGSQNGEEARATVELAESPGHYERILSELGETDKTMLSRAAAIDRAGEQLMIESARVTELRRGITTDISAAEPSPAHGAIAAPTASREYEAEI